MSARSVALIAVCMYLPVYTLLFQSVPRKSGLSFISRLRVHYATTDWSFWMEWTQAVFSIATVILFVTDSYVWQNSYVVLSMKLEVFFTVFFSFNFLFELLLSKNRWGFVMSILGVVDLLTIVPVFAALATHPAVKSHTGFVRMYRVLTLGRIFKPFRLLRAVEMLTPGKDAVLEQTAKTIAYFVSTLFLASGLVQMLSDGQTEEWGVVADSVKMTFHDALYFIIVTFSTVGYGDISPPDTLSRLVIVLLVGFFFFMIPRELNTLNHLLDLSSKYTGIYPKKLTGGHVIVGCDVASCALVAGFLEEFFHEDHGYNVMHLVLLVPHEPTMEWKRLVLRFATNDRVTYLKGDLRSTTDLARVRASTASSCFILTNRHGNIQEEEKRGFMRAITVQDFNPNISIFVEVPTPGMRQRLIKVGINPTRIVCSSTINTRMLANACAWEGASTLINNLLVSASIDEQQDMSPWVKEYTSGLGKEIYVVSIGAFAGRGFSDLVRELFELHGVILLGISEDRRVVLHPGRDYIIKETDLGFLVADDADVAEQIVEKAAGALVPPSFLPTASKPAAFAQGGGATRGSAATCLSAAGTGCSSSKNNKIFGPMANGTMMGGATLTADMRTADVLPRIGRTVAAVGGGLGCPSGEINGDGGNGVGGRQAGGTARGRGRGDEGRLKPSPFLVLDPLSPSPPGKGKSGPDGAETSGGGPAHSSPAGRREDKGGGQQKSSVMSCGAGGTGDDIKAKGHVVLVTPTLAHVATLVEALEVPQVSIMGFVVVCPLYDWNQERDEKEMRRLRAFPQVRLVVGPASRASLQKAGASRARLVVLRAGKSFPEQETSDADAEHIEQLVEVTAVAGPNVHAIVELNDMAYGNHYEILVDLLRTSQAAPLPPGSTPSKQPLTLPRLVHGTATHDRGRTDHDHHHNHHHHHHHRPKGDSNCNASSTFSDSLNHLPLPVTSLARFQGGSCARAGGGGGTAGGGGGEGRWSRSWWGRLSGLDCGVGGKYKSDGSLAARGEAGSDRQQIRPPQQQQSERGAARSDSRRPLPATVAPAAAATAATVRAKEGRRRRLHWTQTKGVASGAIVPSSLPETLLCQAFFNPAIIMIVDALLDPKGQSFGQDQGSDGESGDLGRRGQGWAKSGASAHGWQGMNDNGEDSGGDDEDEGAERMGEDGQGTGGGRADGGDGGGRDGTSSFLAQILPPAQFFKGAMLGGHRPNFQALMNFMLAEYDALPFGLLRHGRVAKLACGSVYEAPKFVHCCPDPGQKVMPLDKVFLLAPTLESWERMQVDSPSSSATNLAAMPRPPSTGSTSRPTTPYWPPPPPQGGYATSHSRSRSEGQCQSQDHRGFPPKPPCTPVDDRGFPFLHENSYDSSGSTRKKERLSRRRRAHANGDGAGGGGGGRGGGEGGWGRGAGGIGSGSGAEADWDLPCNNNTRKPSSLSPSSGLLRSNFFLTSFNSTLRRETVMTRAAANRLEGNRMSGAGRLVARAKGRVQASGSGSNPPPAFPSQPKKGSHAKLDLLLAEMVRLNARLDTIVGRLGALEEERGEIGTGRD